MNINEIFNITDEQSFNELALEIFHYQYEHVSVYKEFVSFQRIDIDRIRHYSEIPFLPIEFFKTHQIISDEVDHQAIFKSSGTTALERSKHFVADLEIYEQSFVSSFKFFYGDPADFCFLALLPSYLENSESSLIYMTDHLISMSKYEESRFFKRDYDELLETIGKIKENNIPCILLGVSYALLDFSVSFETHLNNIIVMETGGMKGRRKEMTRDELHLTLCGKFQKEKIHSEYGMTELLSQSYSKGDSLFSSPPWMKVLIRDINDPKTILTPGRSGGVNVIDLANIYSCSFIATQDLGKTYPNGDFEVLGRFDHSDIRGCNLMEF